MKNGTPPVIQVPRHLWALGLTLCITACEFRSCSATRKGTPSMSNTTSTTKTVCLGRYLFEVPESAEFSLGYARSDSSEVKAIEPPSPTDAAFLAAIETKERDLRAATHRTDGTRLRQASLVNDGKHRVLVYREDEREHRISVVEAHVRSETREWTVGHAISDEDIPAFQQEVARVANGLRARSDDDIPQSPGACVRGGLLSVAPTEGEVISGGARVEQLSWSLSIRSETSKPYEESEQLLTRMAGAIDMAGGASSGIKVLRRREVHLDGRAGQEQITIFPADGVSSFDARLELYGDGTYRTPTLKLWMEANRLAPPDPRDPRAFLSDDEALALWDALLKSIRPRPGAF